MARNFKPQDPGPQLPLPLGAPARRARRRPYLQVPMSHVPGVGWPAVPAQSEALLLALQFQYEQTQWWKPDRLLRHQFRQLNNLLHFAARQVPFYAGRLAPHAAEQRPPLTLESWRALPLLHRTDIQEAGERLHARQLPQGHGKMLNVATSGSTGTPLKGKNSSVAQTLFVAQNLRSQLWYRRDFTRKFCSIRMLKPGHGDPPDGSPGKAWAPVFAPGPVGALNVLTPLDTQIDWLLREAPAYLLTYPSNIDALTERMEERGVSLPTLLDIGTFGETLTPEIRARVTRRTGLPVWDVYSAMEIGVIAIQCPAHDSNYHVVSEGVFVELLDEQGRPCAPGEIGRLVVTPLHNFAMPLVRYEIGDWAQAGDPCPCGRGLPVIARIVGRTRNMLVLPGGDRCWPGAKFSTLTERVPIRQFQFVQRTRTSILARLVVARPVTPEEEHWMQDRINTLLGAQFEVSFEYPPEIARSAGGKFEDFRSEAV